MIVTFEHDINPNPIISTRADDDALHQAQAPHQTSGLANDHLIAWLVMRSFWVLSFSLFVITAFDELSKRI